MIGYEIKRQNILNKLFKLKGIVRGTITTLCSSCNRSNCICIGNKKKSVAYRLTYKTEGQKSKIVYVPQKDINKIKKLILNYKKYKTLLDELVEINVEMFKNGISCE